MRWGRAWLSVIALLACGAFASPALGATSFHARVRGGLGLVPPYAGPGKLRANDVATGVLIPVDYHGGPTMSGGVVVHTVFWAPSGYAFQGQPSGAAGTYEGMIQQFFTDVAHDSTGTSGASCTPSECDDFTVEPQYGWGTSPGQITPGNYSISYNAATDSINDTDSYPPQSQQCASAENIGTCITDGEVQAEIDHIVQSTSGTPRGLTNLWFVFLPPNVDECVDPDVCGSNAFAGYHGVSDVGHGPTMYAVAIDPIIEGTFGPGADPEGFPDAEATIDTAAHETNEAMSDPEGTAWWQSEGGDEIGDMCEAGGEQGAPLGFAPDGSPYNQVINGHEYYFQDMWSNADDACVQATTKTSNALPLPQVNLRQFNPVVTGDTENNTAGIGVEVKLVRENMFGSPVTVAQASTTTAANGSWSLSLAPHAPGDDRDEIEVDYSGAGAPNPHDQVVLTGNGGDPYAIIESFGWTGWFDLDNGAAVTNSGGSSVTIAPCVGVEQLILDAAEVTGPNGETANDLCNTQTSTAKLSTRTLGEGDTLTLTDNDNRAVSDPNGPTPDSVGSLVSLTVPLGEPGAAFCTPEVVPCTAPFTEPLPFFTPGGFRRCIADLEFQAIQCTGLVPNENYTLIDGSRRVPATADVTGTIIEPMLIRRRDAISLSNGSRTLTTLHVARLKVSILGDQSVIAGGTCQAGDYFGRPLSAFPLTTEAGTPSSTTTGGVALTGEICPTNGNAAGLPSDAIMQTDDLSGGLTQVEVPEIQDTSPSAGEDVYGKFTLQATSGLIVPGNMLVPTDAISTIAVAIEPLTGGAIDFKSGDVDTAKGVSLTGLAPGAYAAIWKLTDSNGDTRFEATRFNEERLSRPKAKATCKFVGSDGSRVSCKVNFPQLIALRGTVRLTLTRAGVLVGAGKGRVKNGQATVTMSRLASVGGGAWGVTLALSRPHLHVQTIVLSLRRVA
ncbi:MAG TPA: hypothetical protein VEF89_31025 [Solirubrobacteraceae bacterium]|nr:hypothetical protein [Solirubrobacteraceae bacterium]